MQEATLFKFALCGPEPYCSVLAADMLSFLWRCAVSGFGGGARLYSLAAGGKVQISVGTMLSSWWTQ